MNFKSNFPIFEKLPDLVYLDSAASAQKPGVVIDAMREVMEAQYANVHRGLYLLSEEITEKFEEARKKIRNFIGARSEKEIIFTKNATEAINLVAYAWALDNLEKGDVIVVSGMEHHSNFLPWLYVAEKVGAEVVVLPVDAVSGKLQVSSLKEATGYGADGLSLKGVIERYGGRVKLIAVTHVSNVLGTVNPIKEIVALARSVNARVLVDGCQAVAHMSVDVLDLDVDFYVFSGHKLYGPTGIGVLYGKRDHLEYMHPFLRGGDMVLEVASSKDQVARIRNGSIWKELPWKFEAGTPPIVEAVGLGAVIDFVTEVGFDQIQVHEREMTDYMLEKLLETEGLRLIGSSLADERIGVSSFVVDSVHPHDVAQVLGDQQICVRAGHHCCQPLHAHLGVSATVRASLGMYSSKEDIDSLLDVLVETRKRFL